MSKVKPSQKILKWALERSGQKRDKLEKKFPKLGDWLSGAAQPTLKQLESYAKATATPLGYFFLKDPPKIALSIPHFRTLDDNDPHEPSADLLDTVQAMERRQGWARDFFIKDGFEPLDFINSCTIKEKPEVVAEKIRKALDLGQNWASGEATWTDALRLLRNKMEDARIMVFVNGIVGNNTSRKLSPDEFRGFVLVDKYAPLVFVNGADAKAAQMFTLAHELAHLFLGKSAAFDLRDMDAAEDPTEQACNAIAAEFLVPRKQLLSVWDKNKPLKVAIQNVAKHFKVSSIVAARRGLDTQLITKKQFFEFYNQTLKEIKAEKKKEGGGDFYVNQTLRVGRTFGEMVVRAIKEGKLLYSEAYRLTGLNGNAFDKFAKQRGA